MTSGGGFTTLSAFSLDAVLLWEKAVWVTLSAYVIGSIALPFGALLIRIIAARSLG